MKKISEAYKGSQKQRFLNCQCRWMMQGRRLSERARKALGNNKGMGIVEIALIIVVIVALAFAFKTQIFNLLNNIFEGININELGAQPRP